MTFEEWTTQELVNNGMFDSDAAAVLSRAKSDDVLSSMGGRWNDDTDGYPPQIKAVLWLSIKRIAAEWLAENKPLAWYRPMFEDMGA